MRQASAQVASIGDVDDGVLCDRNHVYLVWSFAAWQAKPVTALTVTIRHTATSGLRWQGEMNCSTAQDEIDTCLSADAAPLYAGACI
jgi:hypothetical protein